MKKLIEWIMYSLDIEMAQKLPIAVSSFFFTKSKINTFSCIKNTYDTLCEGMKDV